MVPASTPALSLTTHHVGIQCNDLDNATAWYERFLGCEVRWSLTKFSPLTTSRLHGITELRELEVAGVRLHLFHRPGEDASPPGTSRTQFQHLCMAVGEPEHLAILRKRWTELRDSGEFRHAFAVGPTDVVTDADGAMSFYAYDVNGLELEFTWTPPSGDR